MKEKRIRRRNPAECTISMELLGCEKLSIFWLASTDFHYVKPLKCCVLFLTAAGVVLIWKTAHFTDMFQDWDFT